MDLLITIGAVGMAGAVLWDAATQDFDRKEISDLNGAALWGIAVVLGMQEVQVIGITSSVFSLLFSANAVTTNILRRPPTLSWGDILIIPPVAGIMMLLGGPLAIFGLMICFFYASVIAYREKIDEIPMIPFAFIGFLIGVLIFLLNGSNFLP